MNALTHTLIIQADVHSLMECLSTRHRLLLAGMAGPDTR